MKQHVLLVEDDKDEVEILTEALRKLAINHKCTWAKDTLHALEMIKYIKPDIIFVDYRMPYLDGIAFIRDIRQHSGYSELPIILYANLINEKIQEEALMAGVTSCLWKTTDFDELCQNLQSLFKKSSLSFNQSLS